MAEPDIRFTLANERTFLFDVSAATTTLSLVLLAAGALSGVAGFSHFRAADRAIRRDEALPTHPLTLAVMTGAVLLAVVAGTAGVLVG